MHCGEKVSRSAKQLNAEHYGPFTSFMAPNWTQYEPLPFLLFFFFLMGVEFGSVGLYS